MRRSVKIAIAAGIIAGIGIYVVHRISTNRKLRKVADDGYETAGDVLFPGKTIHKKLHYGPVLPRR